MLLPLFYLHASCTGENVDDVWSEHCRDESGVLAQYACAMHRLAADIWPQNNSATRLDWCYKTCMNYFFDGGLEHIRAKSARRQIYQHQSADEREECDTVCKSCDSGMQSIQHANANTACEPAESSGSSVSL